MEIARYRALACVPPNTLAELTPARGTIALQCSAPGCARCATFEVEERAEFEKASLDGVDYIVPWNCADHHRRQLAMDAGVRAIPAYVLLSASSEPRVLTPKT